MGFSRVMVGLVFVMTAGGCASPERLNVADTCHAIRNGLADAGVEWPIAQNLQALDSSSLKNLRNELAGVQTIADPEIGETLSAWLPTFETAIPFLLTGDESGFIDSVSETEASEFFSANIRLTDQCQL